MPQPKGSRRMLQARIASGRSLLVDGRFLLLMPSFFVSL